MRKKKKQFNPFDNVGAADVHFNYEGLDLDVYFIDGYDFKDEILRRQMTYINITRTGFSIILEKALYDAVPELYTQDALYAQYVYFNKRTSMNIWMFLGGPLVVGGSAFGLVYLFSTIINAVFIGAIMGVAFMFGYLYKVLKRDMVNARQKLRDDMIKMYGEKKLDELLDKQQKIAEERGYKF